MRFLHLFEVLSKKLREAFQTQLLELPIGSMYGISTYISPKFMVNVGKHTSPVDPMGLCTLFVSLVESPT